MAIASPLRHRGEAKAPPAAPTPASTAGGATVRVHELVKHYGRVRALDGVGFEAAEGEIFGLLGHNGAGNRLRPARPARHPSRDLRSVPMPAGRRPRFTKRSAMPAVSAVSDGSTGARPTPGPATR